MLSIPYQYQSRTTESPFNENQISPILKSGSLDICETDIIKEEKEEQSLVHILSFDIFQLKSTGSLFFMSNGVGMILEIHKDKKLFLSLVGISSLMGLVYFLFPESFNLTSLIFLSAPLSMSIIGYYKKLKKNLNYGFGFIN
jgi:hypothetical protein